MYCKLFAFVLTIGGAFDVGGSATDAARWRMVGLLTDGDTQIEHTSRQHWFLAPSAAFDLGERTRLTVLGGAG